MKKMIKRAVVLTLLATLLVPAAVFAETDTVVVSGDVDATLTLTVPEPIVLGALTVGDTNNSGDESITVATNDPAGLTLKVRDNKQEVGDDIGKMVLGENALTNPLNVKGGDATDYTALSTEEAGPVLIKTTAAAAEVTITDFSVQQEVLWDDPVADGYSITLYFIAANNTE